MHSYIIGFSVYTLAMIGIIFIGFTVVKKCSLTRQGAKSRNNFLEIETSLALAPRKTIHVIRAGNERILIASDVDNTSFLTKLGTKGQQNVVHLDEWKEDESPQVILSEAKNISLCDNSEVIRPKELGITGNQSFDLFLEEKPKVFKDLMMRLQK